MKPIVGLALLSVAACAALPRPVEKPKVQVRDADVRFDAGLIIGEVDLDVTNPNSVGLPLRLMTYTVYLGGQSLSGRTELDRTIPARGTAPVRAALAAQPVALASGAVGVAFGARDYRVDGVLHFATSFGTIEVPFRTEGRL